MNESSFRGVLSITAWVHDGLIVARIRGYRRLNGPVQEIGLAGGEEAIMAKVASWLRTTDRPDVDEPA